MLILSVIFRGLKFMKDSTQKKYHNHISCSFAYKVVCIDDRFSKPIVVFSGENTAYEFIKAVLKEYEYCKKLMKKHFNKSLIITKDEEEQYQSNNNCWICKKLIDHDNEKVRDHCYVTGRFRGAAQLSCNTNLQLTEKFLQYLSV